MVSVHDIIKRLSNNINIRYYIGLIFYIVQGGQVNPAPTLLVIDGPSCAQSGRISSIGRLLVITFYFSVSVLFLAIRPDIFVRWFGVEVYQGLGFYPSRLQEEVKSSAVLPMRELYADPMFRHPGPLDAPVCGPHQSDGNTNLDVYAYPSVGLPSLCCEASGYNFQGSPRLHTQYPINRGNEGREILMLMKAGLQVHISI